MIMTEATVGFRFHPTDIELLQHFLRNKILNNYALVAAISELNVYAHEPWDLSGFLKSQSNASNLYAFSPLVRLSRGLTNRKTKTGFWKSTGRDRLVKFRGETIGFKKTLVFHYKDSRGLKSPPMPPTGWVMMEYRLHNSPIPNPKNFVLCKIRLKEHNTPRAVTLGMGKGKGKIHQAPDIRSPEKKQEQLIHGTISTPGAQDYTWDDKSPDLLGIKVMQQGRMTSAPSCCHEIFDSLENLIFLSDGQRNPCDCANAQHHQHRCERLHLSGDSFSNFSGVNWEVQNNPRVFPNSSVVDDLVTDQNLNWDDLLQTWLLPDVLEDAVGSYDPQNLPRQQTEFVNQYYPKGPYAKKMSLESSVNHLDFSSSASNSGIYVDSDCESISAEAEENPGSGTTGGFLRKFTLKLLGTGKRNVSTTSSVVKNNPFACTEKSKRSHKPSPRRLYDLISVAGASMWYVFLGHLPRVIRA